MLRPAWKTKAGRYLLVNGQPWRAAAGPSVLPILFGVRDAQIQLLWARPVGDGPHNAERVSADVQKVPMANLTSMIVKNRAAEPTRVALAITFDPPRMIDPLMPPRSQPVLESHWPLNDDDPTRIADHRPRKARRPDFGRPHRSGYPRQWPPNRSPGRSLCRRIAGRPHRLVFVLGLDQASSGGEPDVFSRMNSGLRGFDLNYAGSLQAHLISSWDGNAIRVCTIERFDSSQWHHVAVTYDGSSRSRGWKIYLDGALATLQVTRRSAQ